MLTEERTKTHGAGESETERLGYGPYREGISTAVYTNSHTLPQHARTLTCTLPERV